MEFPSDDDVLGHSFRFRPIWWTSRVPAEWAGFLNELPALDRGYHRISRADLLQSSASHLPRALVASYVWGTGSSAFLVPRRARVFRENDSTLIAEYLHRAVEDVRRGNTVTAYDSMLRGHPNYLKYLGPSFFTKFLYAADAKGVEPGRALILDRFVARALRRHHRWEIPENGPWGPDCYERWLDHAHRVAQQEGVRPDAVEMAYFNDGRSGG